jgi:hypothetical protein
MSYRRNPQFLIGALAFAFAIAPALAAPVLNLTTFIPQTTATNIDLNPTGIAPLGISTALYPTLASATTNFITANFNGTRPTDQTFTTAFNTWYTNQGPNYGGNWTLINGGNLNLTFDVVETASASADFAGIGNFQITLTQNPGYTGPNMNQLVWTQGLYTTYQVQPPYNISVNPPFNTLDTYSFSQGNTAAAAFTNPSVAIPGQTPGPNNSTPANIGATPANQAYSDPIYPFQYSDNSFFDGPQAYWPNQSFRAIALLSTITFITNSAGVITHRDLTVFNGIDWGFDLTLPEPNPLIMLLSILTITILRRRRGLAARRRYF